jgi:hypothetical protein
MRHRKLGKACVQRRFGLRARDAGFQAADELQPVVPIQKRRLQFGVDRPRGDFSRHH